MKNQLIARRLRFHIPKDIPRYWNNNCAVTTHIFNAISILAPGFERLAISSVLAQKNIVLHPDLQSQVQGFIGQESAHGSEFIRFNQILKSQGYETKKCEKDNLKKFKWLANLFFPKMHLSLTLGAEHLTAIISALLLKEEHWLGAAYPSCAALWRWHAIEEIEHKAVAFDLYQEIGGGYLVRVLGMWLVTGMLGLLLSSNFLHLAKKDKLLFSWQFWKQCLSVCWGKKGFIRKLILPYLDYYRPGFHPWQQNNRRLISHWKLVFNQANKLEEITNLLEKNTDLAKT